TSFAQVGAPAGMVLANGALALMTAFTSDAQFLEWGWRIPFLASVALVITGFYIRAGVKETPVFEELKKTGAVVKAPLVKVLRENGRGLVLNMVMAMALVSCFANPLFGHLSDKFGRRTITAIGCIIMVFYPFVYFGLLDTKSLPLVFLAIVLSNPLQDI